MVKRGKKKNSNALKKKAAKKIAKKVTKKIGGRRARKIAKKRHAKKILGKRHLKKNFFRRKESDRVVTGIYNFDGLIGGGFEKNSTNLVVGGSGAGKTIFATHFLVEGMKRGEKGLYVTFEEKKEQFFENMKDFGWDLADYEKKGLFTFLEYSPHKVKTMLEEGGGTIESVILKKKISRMVIDSITSFELLFEGELAKREAALELFGMIRDWDCTSLLTLDENVEGKGLTSGTMEFEADSIILLYYIRNKNERQRRIEVVKMRGTKHSSSLYNFEIGKRGIIIGKSAVRG